MKLENIIILVKGLCVLAVGVCTPLGVSLAQYSNTGEWPSRIVWWGVVVPACVVGGGNAISAWLSGSFGAFLKGRNDETPKP